MKPRLAELKLTAISTCLWVCVGCGPANEGTLKGESQVVATKPEMQGIATYGDLLKYRMKEAKEAKEKGKGKDAPKLEAKEKAKDAPKHKEDKVG